MPTALIGKFWQAITALIVRKFEGCEMKRGEPPCDGVALLKNK